MNKLGPILVCALFGCIISSVWSVPLDAVPAADVPQGEGGKEQEPSKEDSAKLSFPLPQFLMGARPSPVTFGNATTQGDVGGLFATNENSLYVVSGPNSNAVANLTSTAAYFAQPINETNAVVDGSDTTSQNLAGFTVTAQEDSHAYAEGEYIQYINHGASYATGWGDSAANGTTLNPGPETTPGGGWKRPVAKTQE